MCHHHNLPRPYSERCFLHSLHPWSLDEHQPKKKMIYAWLDLILVPIHNLYIWTFSWQLRVPRAWHFTISHRMQWRVAILYWNLNRHLNHRSLLFWLSLFNLIVLHIVNFVTAQWIALYAEAACTPYRLAIYIAIYKQMQDIWRKYIKMPVFPYQTVAVAIVRLPAVYSVNYVVLICFSLNRIGFLQ